MATIYRAVKKDWDRHWGDNRPETILDRRARPSKAAEKAFMSRFASWLVAHTPASEKAMAFVELSRSSHLPLKLAEYKAYRATPGGELAWRLEYAEDDRGWKLPDFIGLGPLDILQARRVRRLLKTRI